VSITLAQHSDRLSAQRFTATACLFAILAMLLTTAAPIAMSVAIVFVFAGPHNYVEARYFLTRLPARMGRLKPFFMLSAAGIVLLTVAFPLITRLPTWLQASPQVTVWTIGGWNTLLILWITLLVSMRSRQAPRRTWHYAWPCGIAVMGITWLQPVLVPFVMVYAHPLMGLWVLDREIAQRRPHWQHSYRSCLSLVGLLVVLMWLAFPHQPMHSVSVSPETQQQISHHAGAYLFSEYTARKMIGVHAFLELLHYGIWLVAIPAASGRVFREAFLNVPLMKRSAAVRRLICLTLWGSAGLVVLLWLSFSFDYSTTRDVYFTVAMLHVLAEIPFLLRLL
jgi:hypothetical protein